MFEGRKHLARVIASLGIAVIGGSMLVSTPTFADPNIEDAQAKVDRLYHEAEAASERYNSARVELEGATARLRSLRADLRRQEDRVASVREQVSSAVVAEYQGQGLSSATQVFLADDPDAFLDQLVTVSQFRDQQDQLMTQFATQAKTLEVRKDAAQRERAKIAETEEQLATEKAEIDKKAGEAKDLLIRLKDEAAARAAERAAAASRAKEQDTSDPAPAPSSPTPTPTPTPTSSVSGRAGAAVDYALAQVGDAYVYGAAGPDAFDCSGLTMMAWAQAGVSLPHSSSSQMSSGTSVSSSDLQPGDLVFYYSPVSHVGIYIGNGQIVHAANPSDGVKTAPVMSMPYSGAVRPG
ncbi:MAG: NlpC/P60 family protein [Nocardioidaceae bacterium]